MLVECDTCHVTQPVTVHPVGQSWVNDHHDVANGNQPACQVCYGIDYRGTVLSRAQADRALSTQYGTKSFFRGGQISCYACHNGPVATNLVASDADGAITRRSWSRGCC